jgi:sporulation protein YlmC with PRC-barrel domain
MKTPAITFAAAALFIAPAMAQAPAPQGQSGRFIAQASDSVMRASKIVGIDVIGLDEHRLGDVRDLIMSREGQIEAVVIGVGGVLGIGQKNVAVPFDAMLWNTGDISPAAGPSATLQAGTRPESADAAGAAERMPGAKVANEVLGTTAENRSDRVDPATGPATTGATGQRAATTLVVAPGNVPRRAVVRMTTDEIKNAPEFRAPNWR